MDWLGGNTLMIQIVNLFVYSTVELYSTMTCNILFDDKNMLYYLIILFLFFTFSVNLDESSRTRSFCFVVVKFHRRCHNHRIALFSGKF